MMPRVLLAARSAFETAYVASVFTDRAIAVADSKDDLAHALVEVRAGGINAAVLDFRISAPLWSALIDELTARGIPILLLVNGEVAPSMARGCSVLARPFAAYQVADWVVANRRQTSADEGAPDIPHEAPQPRAT